MSFLACHARHARHARTHLVGLLVDHILQSLTVDHARSALHGQLEAAVDKHEGQRTEGGQPTAGRRKQTDRQTDGGRKKGGGRKAARRRAAGKGIKSAPIHTSTTRPGLWAT